MWTFWEVMQPGWSPVTAEMFNATVPSGPGCIYIRFKNRQATPTPTPTPLVTPTATATPVPNPVWIPVAMRPGGVCEIGRVQVTVFGTFYSFSLTPDGNVKTIRPLPWQSPTVFRIVNYEGPVVWTQYRPLYEKQIGGYEFTYPGGRAGDIFTLYVETSCGIVRIETDIDDPTPTPTPQVTPTRTPTPTRVPLNHRLFLPTLIRSAR